MVINKIKYKKCNQCGIEYMPKNHDTNSKYCCKECRDVAYKNNDKYLFRLERARKWKQNNKEMVKLYNIWKDMIIRCFDDKYKQFYLYGGRGITVCDEWIGDNGFINFYNWAINNGYRIETPNNSMRNLLSIDRIDNNKGYSPDNCRWTDSITQSRNKRVSPQSRTGVSGVRHYEKGYRVTINVDYIQKHIGCFKNFEDAVKARQDAEKLYWGK